MKFIVDFLCEPFVGVDLKQKHFYDSLLIKCHIEGLAFGFCLMLAPI